LFGCSSDDDPGMLGNETPDPVEVTVNTVRPAQLVLFRDGFEAEWKPATKKTETGYAVSVSGAFSVLVVCQVNNTWVTWQSLHTPGDTLPDKDKPRVPLVAPCDVPTLTTISSRRRRIALRCAAASRSRAT
jgi:hypothetical protein